MDPRQCLQVCKPRVWHESLQAESPPRHESRQVCKPSAAAKITRACNNKTMTNATEAEMDKWGSANAHQTQLKMATVTIVKLGAMITQLAASVKNMHYDTLP